MMSQSLERVIPALCVLFIVSFIYILVTAGSHQEKRVKELFEGCVDPKVIDMDRGDFLYECKDGKQIISGLRPDRIKEILNSQ